MALTFGVLGPLEVRSEDDRFEIGGTRRRALLAYLLVHAGSPEPVDRIVDALWSSSAAPGSPATVRTYVSHFRKWFATDASVSVEHRPAGYVLDIPSGALDTARFSAAIGAATSEPDATRRIAFLQDARALWRGQPLDEFAGEAWADEPVRQWTQMHTHAQEMLGGLLLDCGHHREALSLLEPLVVVYPLHEQFWAQLVVARYRCGRQADALAATRDARRVLASELGIEPGPRLVELERQVLAQDPVLDAPREELVLAATSRATVVEPLPSGVVTFFLTDIESSTLLWDDYPDQMEKALVRHEEVVREAVHQSGGRLLKSRGEGDSTFSVFDRASDAVRAAVALQRRLQREPWPNGLVLRTRVALHSGEAQLRDGDYYGGTVNRAARMRSLAAGGEIVTTRATHDLVIDTLADDLTLVHIGTRALPGLRRGETVYALSAPGLESSAAPRSASASPAEHASRLVGRVDAVARVLEALPRPGLVTICGPGGIGKTRVLHEIFDHPTVDREGWTHRWFVELVGASGRVAVESALAEAVGRERVSAASPVRDGTPTGLAACIASVLGARRGLLAIDNCEHVVESLEPILGALATHCPTLSIVATSRQPIGVRDERIVTLGPLEVPDPGAEATPEHLGRVESVRLLVERTRDAGGDLRVDAATAVPIAELCRRLDGIPLALELAAARLASTSPDELVARLRGRFNVLATNRGDVRHRTLHSAIEWSYQLLSDDEKTLLQRLSVFVSGFTLAAAEAVCTTGTSTILSAPDAVYLNLAELVAKSFVVFEGDAARYRLLEPIRYFARERLDETGDLHALTQAHAAWVLQISRAALAPQMLGSAVVRASFRAELDNVQAALAFCETENPGTFMRIVAALGYTWFQSDWRRGRAAADIAVRLAEGASAHLRAAVWLSRGIVEQRNDYHVSAPWLEQARAMYTELGDPLGRAWAAFFLGRARHFDDAAAVEALTQEAMELFRSLGLRIGEAWCLINLSALETTHEEYEAARTRLEGALAIVTELGDDGLRGQILDELGANAFHRGDLVRAQSILRESTSIQRGLGDEYNFAAKLCVAALVDITVGDLDDAYNQIGEVLAIAIRDDDDWLLREALLVLAVLHRERGEIDAARRVLAATEWDVDPPEFMMDLTRSVVVRSLTALAPIVDTAADAAREGRATGRLATAHAILANRRTATDAR